MSQIIRSPRLLTEMPTLLNSFFDDDWLNLDTQWLKRLPAVNIMENEKDFAIQEIQTYDLSGRTVTTKGQRIWQS